MRAFTEEEKRILENIKNVNNFPFDMVANIPVAKKPRGKQKKNGAEYADAIAAFDTETTTIPDAEVNFMYIWQFCINGVVCVGRTWEEFRQFISRLDSSLNNKKLVVFVHFLSYDFQYLSGILEWEQVFCTGRRKVLKAVWHNIEFRCSMLLSGMALDRFTKTQNVEHQKRKDLTDGGRMYESIYTPKSELPEDVLLYSVYDVIGLEEAVKGKMKEYGDSIYTLPLTATGYVRREAKACMQASANMPKIRAMFPDEEIYKALLQAFRGGNTHANRYYAGQVINNVSSYDRSSSYPDVLINCKFPMSQFYEIKNASIDDVEKEIKNGHAVLFEMVAYKGFQLRNYRNGCPYISVSKLENYSYRDNEEDNGRLLKLTQEDPVIMTVTDIDYKIIKKQYTGEIAVMRAWYAVYSYLPEGFRNLVTDYYRKKTKLKGVRGEEFEYNRCKSMINSLYGMMVQKVAREQIEYLEDDEDEMWAYIDPDYSADIEKFNKKGYFSYAWGVWCTAWARYRLQEAIDIVSENFSYDRFIYCDTDSVKFDAEGLEGCEIFADYNKARFEDDMKSRAWETDPQGNSHYIGMLEYEGTYPAFITLGAKRYADINPETGRIEITIAGVNKKCGACQLFLMGGLTAMKDGLIFEESGKKCSEYVDKPQYDIFEYNGEYIELTPYILINKSKYELSLSDDYSALINAIAPIDRTYIGGTFNFKKESV